MILSAKRKNIINIILMIIILSAIIVFIAYPTLREIKSLSQQIYDYRLYLEKLYLQGQLLKNITEELKEVEMDFEKLSKVLIGKNQELSFITCLEKIANENQLIQNLKINTAQELNKDNYKILPINISLQGDFFQLVKYLIELNKLDYYINIKNLSINKIRGAENSKINILIKANSYWEK